MGGLFLSRLSLSTRLLLCTTIFEYNSSSFYGSIPMKKGGKQNTVCLLKKTLRFVSGFLRNFPLHEEQALEGCCRLEEREGERVGPCLSASLMSVCLWGHDRTVRYHNQQKFNLIPSPKPSCRGGTQLWAQLASVVLPLPLFPLVHPHSSRHLLHSQTHTHTHNHRHGSPFCAKSDSAHSHFSFSGALFVRSNKMHDRAFWELFTSLSLNDGRMAHFPTHTHTPFGIRAREFYSFSSHILHGVPLGAAWSCFSFVFFICCCVRSDVFNFTLCRCKKGTRQSL